MPTIMIRHATDDQLAQAMRLTRHRSSSKALVDCIEIAVSKTAEASALRQQINKLKEDLAFSQQVIQRAADSASALLAHVAQGDAFND